LLVVITHSFFDDVEGLGTEHGALIHRTGISPADVAAWNAARLPVYQTMHKKLRESGAEKRPLLCHFTVKT
jgi:hypothetical protein